MVKRTQMTLTRVIGLSLFFAFFSDVYANGDDPMRRLADSSIGESVSSEPDSMRTLELSPHVWDRYVRGFRRDHNLSLESGYSSTTWIVDKFGDLRSKNYRSRHLTLVANYTFHILIAGKTGYFLGSSAGYALADEKKMDDQFQPTPSWFLPGVQAGLTYNYDPSGRIIVGVGAQLERFNDLKTRRNDGSWQNASLTGESFQFYFGADLFLLLDTAVHIIWSDSTTFFKRPADAEDKLVDLKIKRRSQGASLGLLYHFL
jgi:hypothetical protein